MDYQVGDQVRCVRSPAPPGHSLQEIAFLKEGRLYEVIRVHHYPDAPTVLDLRCVATRKVGFGWYACRFRPAGSSQLVNLQEVDPWNG